MRYIGFVLLAIFAGLLALSGTASATSPTEFEEVGQLDLPAKKAVFEGSFGYVIGGGCRSVGTPPEIVCDGTFTVLDVAADPAPVVLAQREVTGEGFEDIAVSGDHAYVVVESPVLYGMPASYRLAVMDVSARPEPVEISSIDIEDGIRNIDSEIVGSYLFLSSSAGVVVYDLANPTAPVEVGHIDVSAAGIDVEGTTLFVAGDGFHVFDISAPSSPVELAALPGDMQGVEVFGRQVFTIATYFCDSPDNPVPYPCGTFLIEFDVANPSNPVSKPLDIGGAYVQLLSISKYKEFLLVGDSGGLRVLNLRLPERDEIDQYFVKVGQQFSEFAEIDVRQERIFTITRTDDKTVFRTLRMRAFVTSFLAFITNTSEAYAQGPDEDRFGIGEADYGNGINWSGQNYY